MDAQPGAALAFAAHRYHPQMLDWVADEIVGLVREHGVPPGQIAVLAPFLTGALRFALANKLAARGIPTRSHRPSRALRDEPATQCLLTLATFCHPHWGIVPSKFDVAHALMLAIDELDLVRAHLLADIAYRPRDGVPILLPFVELEPTAQERITFLLGGRYEGLRTWLAAHTADGRAGGAVAARRGASAGRRPAPLDHFLGRLFGELLSQPGYRFHRNYDAGEVAAKLIESVRKFREVMEPSLPSSRPSPPVSLPSALPRGEGTESGGSEEVDLGREYFQLVQDGVVAAQYVRSWRRQPEDAVLLAPAYTFLMMNRPVAYQFWLDVGATGWWERLHQPLTHPYVLSREWRTAAPWTDAEEYVARQEALAVLALGLIRRCRKQVFLGLSELSEQGSEQRGPLLHALQRVLREG